MANWKELSGENNWTGLLKPLNKDLGQIIIHYGERVQAIYDTIDDDESSPTYGLPKYEEKEFFSKVGLGMYTMKNYLYAKADVMCKVDSNLKDQDAWIGYVAVATDEANEALGRRDIMICWRGTLKLAEWMKNLQVDQTSASPIFGELKEDPYVHKGFLSIYMSAREKVLKAVRELVHKYKDEEISITISGHSLGSAIATLNAADIVANGYNKPTGSDKKCMVTGFVFASPKVGNEGFKSVFNNLSNLHLLHIKDDRDPVPKLPRDYKYKELGNVLSICTNSISPTDCHHLKKLLEGVEATKGR